ncbi:MAG: inorganic phosphate transporter [Bacteroidia bacterium]|nr:inorganic phosphate transporter [Bacteroidia bacterium]
MEIYYVILAVLLLAAIADLVVGVANDAVNFLNSAIGSKVAPRVLIMLVASAGIIVGVTFSSGMMEIARKGIFNPEMLTFPEVMIIFAATMLTDVLLLDLFNTFGLPTSTTVSLVFELLGAAFSISLVKVLQDGGGVSEALAFINTASVLKILFSIVLSVVVAFIAGALIQYLSRMLFTFDINSRIKRYGSIWGGAALAGITYFLLVKGAKGASFLDASQATWLKDHALMLAGLSLVFWTLVMQFVSLFTRVNVFKPVVLAGTFALAMAFAANDLVNFIGAPLAGLAAFEEVQYLSDPLNTLMGSLAEPVRANTMMLLIAGLIMAATLWMSKKARTVTATEVNLGRQGEGAERFEANPIARSIVRMVLSVFRFFGYVTPASWKRAIERRFDTSKYQPVPDENGEYPSFDYLRASVNLIVSALLISFGTTLKLPLSTTYVTFMVAMATALPDRAWGRDSAVYRVSGVLTVVGGWFFTALIAASSAALIAVIIFYTQLPGLIAIMLIALLLLGNSIRVHRRREREHEEENRYLISPSTMAEASKRIRTEVSDIIAGVAETVRKSNDGLASENRLLMKEARDQARTLAKRGKGMAHSVMNTAHLEESEDAVDDKSYAEVIGSISLLLRGLRNMTGQCYTHVNNNHRALTEEQILDLKEIEAGLLHFLERLSAEIKDAQPELSSDTESEAEGIVSMIRKADKRQLKRSKKEKQTTRSSLLMLEILTEYEEIVYHTMALRRRSAQLADTPGL